MKVEFFENGVYGDGRYVFITANEFNKADKNREEYASFAFATHAFFTMQGLDCILDIFQYRQIKKHLEKGGAVIITTKEGTRSRDVLPCVYVSNNNRLKYVDIDDIDEEILDAD